MNKRIGAIELRYADMPWGTELDEVVMPHVHIEDLGAAVYVGLGDTIRGVTLYVVVERMPRAMWWDAIVEAWYERRLPCFTRPALRLMETWGTELGDPAQGGLAL